MGVGGRLSADDDGKEVAHEVGVQGRGADLKAVGDGAEEHVGNNERIDVRRQFSPLLTARQRVEQRVSPAKLKELRQAWLLGAGLLIGLVR